MSGVEVQTTPLVQRPIHPHNGLAQMMENVAMGVAPVELLQARLISMVSHRQTAAKLVELSEMVEKLADTSSTGEEDSSGHVLTVSEKSLKSLEGFLDRERSFTNRLAEMAEHDAIMARIGGRARQWVRENTPGDSPLTQEDLASLAEFISKEEAPSIMELTKGWEDRNKFPDRPWVKVMEGHREGRVPTLYILGWREGEATPIHDHGPSEVGAHISEGAVEEEVFTTPKDIDYETVVRSGIEFKTVKQTRLLSGGETVKIGAPYIHVFRCHEDGEPRGIAITVNAYTDLKQMRFFQYVRDDGGEYLSRMSEWETQDLGIDQVDTPKLQLLDELVPVVNSKIGRNILEEEARALGFLVNKLWKDEGAEDFLVRAFGIEYEDARDTSSFKIYSRIHDEARREVTRRIRQYPDEGEKARLRAVRRLINAQHHSTLKTSNEGSGVYLGAVPYHFLPAWVRAYYLK